MVKVKENLLETKQKKTNVQFPDSKVNKFNPASATAGHSLVQELSIALSK